VKYHKVKEFGFQASAGTQEHHCLLQKQHTIRLFSQVLPWATVSGKKGLMAFYSYQVPEGEELLSCTRAVAPRYHYHILWTVFTPHRGMASSQGVPHTVHFL